MHEVRWGIIGCGDVTEVKSGPAFNLIPKSTLVAVMRRNKSKAQDYAIRHKVSQWYDSVDALLENDTINSIYIATPPSSHIEYALRALKADKNVYLEKPMALNAKEAETICEAVNNSSGKLSVAHYRRKLPAFVKVKELLKQNVIGKVLVADIQILQPIKSTIIANTVDNWRLNPQISGGGYFHDLAPHQIDLMYHYFGPFDKIEAFSITENGQDLVESIVNGIINFKNGIQFRGIWNFVATEKDKKDECIIYGTKGSIRFYFYGEEVHLLSEKSDQIFRFKNPKHIQQPMIEAVVNYFLGKEKNPCSAQEGLLVMQGIDQLCGR
ncbi:Gfo/Idh/MocA family protein [Spongiivirga citrea]|uniref:Gfo/Idh/MocA family oxidoreductase n=1 Tax=Spongiivirga citrea TaxID=1481457 RepID=A0A6M0CVQ1_9FLAO|nr:Gfo/Idh/MocA family oxidoreductase [Spongiivirga citrea]NER17840.1 Gfo/Idh/MocA family oxidoreductase [Spongiivirga citrea]